MILTDKDLMIICLSRSFEYSETERYFIHHFRVAVGFKFPVEKSASLKLDDMKISEEEIERLNVPGKDGKLPRANDLYFMILRCCHMGMINPILKQFDIKNNEELKEEDKEKFLEALRHGYKFFDRPIAGSGYLIRTKENPSKDSKASVKEAEGKPSEQGQVISTQKDDHNYIDFTPILFEDYTSDETLVVDECNDFDVAMRTYFETAKLPRDEDAHYQNQVWRKYENIRVCCADLGRPRGQTEADQGQHRGLVREGAADRKQHQRDTGHH